MSKPSPLSRSSSSESLVDSSSHETTTEEKKSKSSAQPVMKTKTKKSDQREDYKASSSFSFSSSSSKVHTEKNHDIGKSFKNEIDAARKLNAKKEQWEKFSKSISPDGVLRLKKLNNEAIQNLAEWLNTSFSSKLTGLQIQWNEGAMSKMDYKAAKALASAIQTNTSITSLEITQSDIDNRIAEFITDLIKSNSKSKITKLNLSENKITAESAKVLFEILKTNTTITALSLKNSYLGDEGANVLADVLKTNTTITTVDLSENNITAVGAQALAKMLKINETIISLYISDNKIGDEGAKVLAEALKINPTITLLNISDNNIIGDGAKALAETLKTNTTITTLYIQCNLFGTEEAKAFAEAMKTNTTITTLYIIEAYFSRDGLTYIKMINQHCALNAQRVLIEKNIAAALDLLTAHPNPIDGNVTSVQEVNGLIAEELFLLDKEGKLNTAKVINDPNSAFNKYT